MVFCNIVLVWQICNHMWVTILILIDGFLQYRNQSKHRLVPIGHNPYFNRWFSAIGTEVIDGVFNCRHNPYFNRWFSAIH